MALWTLLCAARVASALHLSLAPLAAFSLAALAAFCGVPRPVAAAKGHVPPELLREQEARVPAQFQRLWQVVVQEKKSRGWEQDAVLPVTRVCQYGVDNATLEIARWLLAGDGEPGLPSLEVLELHDVERDSSQAELATLLEAEFGRMRVRRLPLLGLSEEVAPDASEVQLPEAGEDGFGRCNFALVSRSSSGYTIERLLQHARGSPHITVAFVSAGCITPDGDGATAVCDMLQILWGRSLLMRRGYCLEAVCMSRVPVAELRDPNVLPLDCAGLTGRRGPEASRAWTSATAEFAQDWFVYWNFVRGGPGDRDGTGRGLYVDVGSSWPYEYSSTVALDRCLGWKGVCVEANPDLTPFIEAYRTCQVFPNCADDEQRDEHAYGDTEGDFAFTASCLTLGEILNRAGLQGRRIDVLSVDVEHAELRVLRGLPADADIRVIVIEVGRGVRWLEVDTILLPRGFVKVALLGRDAVYVRQQELWPAVAAENDGPGTASPSSAWTEHLNTYLEGYAADDDSQGTLEEMQARCAELGRQCGGVTCEFDLSDCTVRAGRAAMASPYGEVSYAKALDVWPMQARGRILLPPMWSEFHQRVVDEESEHEMVREKEARLQGLRRM